MNRFIIDGYDLLEAYRIKVLTADGLDIIPKVKKRDDKSWPEESGLEVDTDTDIVYEAQDITLNCYVEESTYSDAIKRINGLINKLSDNGYHLLGSEVRNRLYPVLLQEVSNYQRRTSTNASKVAITFSVKLLNPLPECRMGSATVLDAGEVSLDAETNKEVTVWWGDGTSSAGIGLLTHTYTNAGTYTILIAGTSVTASLFTVTGCTIDEYSYPATGDITHIETMPTSGMAYSKAEDALNTANGKEDIGVAAGLITSLKDNVPTPGNTLNKLYSLIVNTFSEITAANISARNAYDAPLGCHVFVTDDGDGKWALYKATTSGVGATYIKLSDPDLLNALMSASAIKSAYESNADTNAFTNALLSRLNALSQTSNPEFANVFNTALNTSSETGGEITPTLWAWIQSVYSSIVAKSVKSNIIGIWTYLFGVIPTKQDKLTLLATEETGTFTLALTHLDKVVPCNSNTDMIVNIPLNSVVGFEIGTTILIKQRGLGVITATAISGVTLLSDPKTQGQYKMIALYKEAINTWTVIGGTT